MREREKSAARFAAAIVFVVLFTFAAAADCLPCKEEVDNGMGVLGARLYADTIANAEVRPVDVLAARFYANGVETIFSPLAKAFLTGKHGRLTDEQTARLMKRIDLQCYNADYLIAWALMKPEEIAARAPGWTTKILKWAKDDQLFYTKLSAELKD